MLVRVPGRGNWGAMYPDINYMVGGNFTIDRGPFIGGGLGSLSSTQGLLLVAGVIGVLYFVNRKRST